MISIDTIALYIKRIQFLETRKTWVHRFVMWNVFRLDPDNVKALYRRAESRIRQQRRKEPQRSALFLVVFRSAWMPIQWSFGDRPVKATAYDHDLAIKETDWNKTWLNPTTDMNLSCNPLSSRFLSCKASTWQDLAQANRLDPSNQTVERLLVRLGSCISTTMTAIRLSNMV